MNRRSFPVLLAVTLLALVCAVSAARGAATPSVRDGRVVVLGFDGADSRTTARMIEEGQLPNLAQLAQRGTFAPLVSTHPAESAAGWAALNTGTNPLKNGVPSFIKRQPDGNALPTMGHVATEEVPLSELEPRGLLGALARYGAGKLTGAAAGAAFLVFLVLFRLLLKVQTVLSFALSAVLAGAGGFAVNRVAVHVPTTIPNVYRSLVEQPGFWDVAAEHGKRAIVLDAALAFGRPATDGARVLGGLGLPDVRGASNGNWFVYTTNDTEMQRPPQGRSIKSSGTGTSFRVEERDGRVVTHVYGPVDFTKADPIRRELDGIAASLEDPKLGWKEANTLRDRKRELEGELQGMKDSDWDHRVSLPMELARQGERLQITIAGQTQEAAEGQWTGWFKLPFELNPLVTASAITRVRVMELGEFITVYLHTFDIDPEDPPFWQPVSSPAGFSRDLADWIGEPFETLGWSCMTNQMKDKALPVDVFLEDIEFTLDWRKRMTLAALERDDWELLFSVFSTTDRVQHIMYRFHDPEHPLYDAQEAAREVTFFGQPTALKDVIPAIYRQMDAVVGEVVARLGPDDTLMLCADHGFTSYRRGMEVNNWLVRNGYMTLRPGVSQSKPFAAMAVDWSQTRAYSLGLGMVYLNLADREPQGIVTREEAPALLREIGEALLQVVDPGPEDAPYDVPHKAVHDYAIMDELYDGPGEWGTPEWPCADLQIGFAEYFRASWDTVFGKLVLRRGADGAYGLAPDFTDNTNNWSGDHASNSPEVVTGIFFCSRPAELPPDGVSVMHVAPTALALLGVPIPELFDHAPLAVQ